MKRVLKVLAALALLVPTLGALVATGVTWTLKRNSRRAAEDQMSKVERAWESIAPQLEADEALWAHDPLVLSHPGDDAAAFMAPHFQWEDNAAKAQPAPVLPPPLMDKLKTGAGFWPENISAGDLEGVDLDWMAQLGRFGVWDLEGEGPLKDRPVYMSDDPIPRFSDAFLFAKARLAQGLARGDARPAGEEVRALARLCWSTERFIGAAVGVSLLTIERRGFEEAKRRNQSVEGWAPRSRDDVEALRRLLAVGAAPLHLLAGPTMAKPELTVGRCASIYDGLLVASLLRDFLSDELSEEYAARKALLDASPCRLRRMRAAWAIPRPADPRTVEASAFCNWKREGECPVSGIKWFPLLRSTVGTLTIPSPEKLLMLHPNPDGGAPLAGTVDGGFP
jgi:hypothetical protein